MKKPLYPGWYLIFPGNNFVWYSCEEEALRQKMFTPCVEGPFWVTDPKMFEEHSENRIPH